MTVCPLKFVCIYGLSPPLHWQLLEGKNRFLFTFVFPIMLSIFLMYNRYSGHICQIACGSESVPSRILMYAVRWVLVEIFTSQMALGLSCSVYFILAFRKANAIYFSNNAFKMARFTKKV